MSGTRAFSVRRFLLISLIGMTAVLWAVSGYFSYRDARAEISEIFDSQLSEAAKTLLVEGFDDDSRDSGARRLDNESDHEHDHKHKYKRRHEHDEADEHSWHRYSQPIYFQIWDDVGRLLRRSGPAIPESGPGYMARDIGADRYRTFTLFDKKLRRKVQVAQLLAIREQFTEDIALHIMLPLLVALPLLALLILWSVNRALGPLALVAREVSRKDPRHLDPLAIKQCPAEIRPLVEGINSLLGRLEKELEKERRFTSDASHELRTPLAALRAQAEVAINASQFDARKHALEQIILAVDRTGHLVSQLLTLARLDPDATLEGRETVDLCGLAGEVLRDLAPQAIAKSIDLSFSGEGASVQGNRAMLSVLVRNLVDNAIRYTPERGVVRVTVRSSGATAVLEVHDNGPGIPQGERARVFDRFYRIPGAADEGSGLGLSIVKRIVDLHVGSIALEGSPGLQVRVLLPAAFEPIA